MGKCKKCGVEVPKEAMFCPNCGAGIPKEAPVEKIAGEKGRRKKKYVMIGGGIGAILLILLVIFVSTRPKVIDLNECRKIEIDGYDGVGNGNAFSPCISKAYSVVFFSQEIAQQCTYFFVVLYYDYIWHCSAFLL